MSTIHATTGELTRLKDGRVKVSFLFKTLGEAGAFDDGENVLISKAKAPDEPETVESLLREASDLNRRIQRNYGRVVELLEAQNKPSEPQGLPFGVQEAESEV